MIVGLILIIVAGFLFFTKSTEVQEIGEEVKQEITEHIDPTTFKTYIESCLRDTVPDLVKKMAEQGGTLKQLSPYGNARAYNNVKYRYFCNYQAGKGCLNNLILRKDMEEELSNGIKSLLMGCINLDDFRKQGYSIEEGEMKVESVIAIDDINIKINYPLKIKKGDFELELNEFSSVFFIPLGQLYDLAVEITNSEITEDYFNKDEWMQKYNAEIKIQKHRPYPDIAYSLKQYVKRTNKEHSFNFAIQGTDTVSMLGQIGSISLFDYCQIDGDKNCYANTPQAECGAKGGTYTNNPTCEGLSTYGGETCKGGQCKDCRGVGKKHGDTWCEYDTIVGRGFDRVGTRHYQHSCIDGEVYVEGCRDYREEICTQQGKAVCRVNRWWDCNRQTSSAQCLDETKRDCYWFEALDLSKQSKCHPYVPPGFKFWEGNGLKVCNYANENHIVYQPTFRRLQAITMPNSWVDATAINCFMQGDCGDYRNIVGERSKGNYFNSDNMIHSYSQSAPKTESEYIYLNPVINRKYFINLRTDANNKITNLNFDPHPTVQEAIDFGNAKRAEASSWGVCDALECNWLGIPKRPFYSSYKKWMAGIAICDIWKALPGGDCDFCSKDPLKPCTEYKCRSLGKACFYNEDTETGIGSCSSPVSSTLNEPLIVKFSPNSLPPGYAANEDYFVWADKLLEGYGITPKIKTTSFEFEVETNNDATCKVVLVPGSAYNSQSNIPVGTVISSGKIHRIKIDSTLLEFTSGLLKSLLDVSSYLEAVTSQIQSFGFQQTIPEMAPEGMKGTLQRLMIAADARKYYYFIRCIDRYGKEDAQSMFVTFSRDIEESSPPTVTLIHPDEEDTFSTGEEISFGFKAGSTGGNELHCSLFYGKINNTNITNWHKDKGKITAIDAIATINSSLVDGTYAWNIECTDYINKAAGQENRTIIMI